MPDYDDQPAADPPVGSAEYWRLAPDERYRIAMASIGIGSSEPGFAIRQTPYSQSDENPIDHW